MKKSNYIAELSFLTVLLLIDFAFLSQLLEPENDPLQVVGAVEYARVIMGLFTVALIAVMVQSLQNFIKYIRSGVVETVDSDEVKQLKHLSRWLILGTGVVFCFYCVFMRTLGYYSTGLIVIAAYQMLLYKAQEGKLHKKGVLIILGISIGVTVLLYLVFSVAFQLYLPRGILR